MARPRRGPGGRSRRLSSALVPRLRVLPTARGWQVLVAGACSFAVALSLGTTQLYQLAYALLGLLVASLVLGLAGSRSLGLKRHTPATVRDEGISAGGSATLGLRLTNGSRLAASRVEVVDRLPNRTVSRPPTVPAGEERLVRSTVSFPRRGLYGIGPAEVSWTDPLGLLRLRRIAGLESEVLVYPEIHPAAGLAVRGSETAGGRAIPASRGEEFSGLRDYRPGDDRRFIHWKSVARTGELVVKEFDPEAPRRYSVLLDLSAPVRPPSGAGREVEDSVSAAASVVSHLEGAGLAYNLRLTDLTTSSTGFGAGPVQRSRSEDGGYHEAMRLLAAAEADGDTGCAEALLEESSRGSLGDVAVLVQREATENEEGERAPGDPRSRSLRETERRMSLAEAVRQVSSGGVSVIVVLAASHTYEPALALGGEQGREARHSELVQSLEVAGATVRVLRRETGVAGLGADRNAV